MIRRGRDLLDEVYTAIEARSDSLLDAVPDPSTFLGRGGIGDRWTDLGDWLGLAARLGAEKVLFVRGDPVAVFSDAGAAPSEAALGELYRRAWCMSEPRCLFVALPDQLRIYSLSLPPKRGGPPSGPWRVLASTGDVLDFTKEIDQFGPDLRGLMETGGATPTRADKRLIEDLRRVRGRLEATGLSMAQAHALIGRSILVRYLEDRGVLTRPYFERIADGNPAWQHALDSEGPTPVLGASGGERLYDRVLRDAAFTHALFRRLAADFNGDLFELGEARDKRFDDAPLQLLRSFLLGEIKANQQPLFFWAYDFGVVPLALISSIYEQFYHDTESRAPAKPSDDEVADEEEQDDAEGGDASGPVGYVSLGAQKQNCGAGTHYTPASLVHDALRRTLTPAQLALKPTILDPACGSGIFLVEAFRRVVRFEAQKSGRKLTSVELRDILQTRLVGVEVNAEAARVAAFSLYLALLDQQEPPDIVASGTLPHLIHTGERREDRYGILVVANAFALTTEERQTLTHRVVANKVYAGRSGDIRLLAEAGRLDLPAERFDVVVGNPPWQEAPSQNSLPRLWAAAFGLPAGEGSYSQLFIHRAFGMLREGGTLGLLVGVKVFWNDRDTSRAFRAHLLARASLKQVVNMAHVRRMFFAKAVAPFAFLLAENRPPLSDNRVVLWNARRTGPAERLRSLSAVPLDRRVVPQRDLADMDYLWKLYWWGGHHDAAFVAKLGMERTLGEAVKDADPQPSYGWQRGTTKPSGKVAALRELSNRDVRPFGPMRDEWLLPPPTGIKRNPDQRIYEGQRLVVTRGIREPIGPVARLDTEEFTFRHIFYCVPLPHLSEHKAKLILGVLWSSLGRYMLFMTSGSWGGWHDQVTSQDLLGLPLRLAASWGMPKADHDDAALRIVQAVDRLRGAGHAVHRVLLQPDVPGPYKPSAPEYDDLLHLDQAVFDLFEASQAERDLVTDFWAETHDLFWKGSASKATKRVPLPAAQQGIRASLPQHPTREGLQRYLAAFLDAWNPRFPEGTELGWQVAGSPAQDSICVAFFPSSLGRGSSPPASMDWQSMVASCAAHLAQPVSPAFHTKRTVRAATGDGFLILRENSRRLWTASTAREDAEAFFVQLASGRRQD